MALLRDNGYRIFMTCIDHFSKIVVLVSSQKSNAETVGSHFLIEAMSYHKLLAIIISDRDIRL